MADLNDIQIEAIRWKSTPKNKSGSGTMEVRVEQQVEFLIVPKPFPACSPHDIIFTQLNFLALTSMQNPQKKNITMNVKIGVTTIPISICCFNCGLGITSCWQS